MQCDKTIYDFNFSNNNVKVSLIHIEVVFSLDHSLINK